jgi:hypothetical protein
MRRTVASLLCLSTALSASAPDRDARVAAAAEALRPTLVAEHRDFHEHPELSNRETRTAQVVAERLRALGLEVHTGIARHGVVALLRGGKPGPVVAYRADMDALPILETHDVPYKSLNPSIMHACGHDAHTTIGLGVAAVLAGMRKQVPGTVKFIFQPAEEGAPDGEEGGAALMVKEGVLERPAPAAIFGLHVTNAYEAGTMALVSGSMLASVDTWSATIHGKMSHGGAAPHKGIDAIYVAAQAIEALQSIRSRRVPGILEEGPLSAQAPGQAKLHLAHQQAPGGEGQEGLLDAAGQHQGRGREVSRIGAPGVGLAVHVPPAQRQRAGMAGVRPEPVRAARKAWSRGMPATSPSARPNRFTNQRLGVRGFSTPRKARGRPRRPPSRPQASWNGSSGTHIASTGTSWGTQVWRIFSEKQS